RRQRHVDGDGAVVADVDLVDQSELVDVGRDFRVIDGLERRDDIVGQLAEVVGRARRRRDFEVGTNARLGSYGLRVFTHANTLCALIKAFARTSTSSRVLYMPNEARQVAVRPYRASSGITQCVPARTATPARSITVATSCGCAPFISNDTIAPLSFAL